MAKKSTARSKRPATRQPTKKPARRKKKTANRKPPKTTGTIEYTLSGLGTILRNYRIQVPKYQRDYAWKQQHVTDLLDDLAGAIQSNEPRHFLGSVVMTQVDTGRLEVVDGQQRLATIFMIICAIRDYFANHNDSSKATAIDNKYLRENDLSTNKDIVRLQLNATDNPYFQSHVVDSSSSSSEKIKSSQTSHTRIQQAFDTAKARIDKLAEVSGTASDKALIALLEYIDHSAAVIHVIVPDSSTAFTIFETLNDRGIELAITDLIKNFLFASAEEKINEAQAYWLRMSGVLDSITEKDANLNFLRHFWSSYQGLTREKAIFKSAKNVVKSDKQAIKLCSDLARNAIIYAAITNPQNPYWRKYSPESRANIAALQTMRMTQVRPLILAACDSFTPLEVQKTLRVLVSASVRILVSQSRGGTIEKLYADIAKQIRSKSITNAKGVLNSLSKHTPNNAEFLNEFSSLRVSKEYLSRYYLRHLEQFENKDIDGLEVSENSKIVSLEHVLPKKRDGKWKSFDDETHSSNLYKIGNQCLLTEDDNASLGNDTFVNKKKVFASSKLLLTREISSVSRWTQNEIDNRGERLAKIAIHAWPMSVKIVKKSSKTT